MNRKQRRQQKKVGTPTPPLKKSNAPHLDALFEQGRLHSKKGEFAPATRIFADILKADPTHYGAVEELGVAAFKMKDYEKALSFFMGLKQMNPTYIKTNAYIGNTYTLMEKYAEAFDYLKLAIEEWGQPFIHKAMGNVYSYLGNKEKAKHHLKTAFEQDPDNLDIFYSYLMRGHKIKTKDDPLFQHVKDLEDNKDKNKHDHNLSNDDQIFKYLILFQAYDQLGEHEKAFDYLLEANKRTHAAVPKIMETFRAYHGQLKTFFTKPFLDSYAGKKHPSKRPVFILGMPRSGTTLLEQILHAHPDVVGIGEDMKFQEILEEFSFFPRNNGAPYPLRQNKRHNRYISPFDIAEQYEFYLEQKTNGETRVINKAITLFYEAAFIYMTYEKPKMIHIKRNAVDSCLSTFTQYFTNKGQPYSYDLTELGEYYKLYTELMAHWENIIPGTILHVNYEDIVDDIEGSARKIIDFLELPWNERCLEFYKAEKAVKTASLEQVRQPIYTSSVGRWKKYGPKIIPLIEALGQEAPPEAISYMKEIKSQKGD